MTDTPIIDAAHEAGEAVYDQTGRKRDLLIAALRAALPWDPTAEAVAATAGIIARVAKNHAALFRTEAIAAYRAQPIMRELYPEKFI